MGKTGGARKLHPIALGGHEIAAPERARNDRVLRDWAGGGGVFRRGVYSRIRDGLLDCWAFFDYEALVKITNLCV